MAGRNPGTTLYLVTYDIVDDRRRAKVHQVLTGFGDWVQQSVFECHLTKRELILLRAKLHPHVNPRQDNLRVYSLCDACVGRVDAIGSDTPAPTTVYLL